MKNITAYKRWAVVVMIVVMGFDIFTGLRPLCANGLGPIFRALGMDRLGVAIAAPNDDREQIFGSAWATAEGRGGTSKCCCKRQKSCPAIPRTAITSNPTQRFNEVQRDAQLVYCDSFVPQGPDLRLATRGNAALLELAWRATLYSFTPLELTCVLLI